MSAIRLLKAMNSCWKALLLKVKQHHYLLLINLETTSDMEE